jgi:hypothetical protein
MADGLPRFCIFGDSHYACLRQAEAQGLVDVTGVELEYWGHVGGRFRYLEARDGAIHPVDDFTAMRFAKFNAKGRRSLPAADFDVILVMGARVYVWRLFLSLLGALAEGPFLSRGLQRRILTDGLRGQSGYRLARGLAESGTASILLARTAYYTVSEQRTAALSVPGMAGLIADRLPEFWATLEETAAEDGIRLLRQPDQTVVQGMLTDATFAIADHAAKQDYEHHNAAYGAIVLSRVMEIARQVPRRGSTDRASAAGALRPLGPEREA